VGESHRSFPHLAPLCGIERFTEPPRGSLLLSLCRRIGGLRGAADAVGSGLDGRCELYMEDSGVVGAAEW
jgi:hypothetical protein